VSYPYLAVVCDRPVIALLLPKSRWDFNLRFWSWISILDFDH